MQKLTTTIIAAFMVISFVLPVAVNAQPITANDLFGNGAIRANVQTDLGLGNRDPREIAASIIRVLLGFLGIIATLIILMGGFKWMTAGGSEDGIEEAKKMISAGVIGLIIILASWGLATFIINALVTATS